MTKTNKEIVEELYKRAGMTDKTVTDKMRNSGLMLRAGKLNLVKRSAAGDVRPHVSTRGDVGAGDQSGAEDSLEAVLATDEPTLVWDWRTDRAVREILPMSCCVIPSNGQVPMLDSHWAYGSVATSIKGSFRGIRVAGNSLCADPVLSSLSGNETVLINEGHLTDLSAGYRTNPNNTLRIAPGSSGIVNGVNYENNYPDQLDLVVRTKWWIMEGSLVTIGADDRSKFRQDSLINEYMNVRSMINGNRNETVPANGHAAPSEGGNGGRGALITINQRKDSTNMDGVEKTVDTVRSEEIARITEIQARADAFISSVPESADMAREAIQKGDSASVFGMRILDKMAGRSHVEQPVSAGVASKNDLKEYSLSRAISLQIDRMEGRSVANCVELELSEEIHKRSGVAGNGGIYVPAEVMARSIMRDMGKRTLLSTENPTTGGNLVPEEFRSDMFVELLRNKTITGQAGVTILSGLKGNIVIPKQLTGSTFAMVGYGDADESNVTISQVTASPKFGSAWTRFHRSLLLQSGIGIEGLVTGDLLNQSYVGVDKEIIRANGGLSVQGIMHTTGVKAVVAAETGLTLDKILEFEENHETTNADQLGELKFILSPKVKRILRKTPRIGMQYPDFLLEKDGTIEGHPSFVTNQVPDGALIGGVFSEVVRCDWGLFEILVNQFGANSKSGEIEVTLFVAFDSIIKRAQALQVCSDVPLT